MLVLLEVLTFFQPRLIEHPYHDITDVQSEFLKVRTGLCLYTFIRMMVPRKNDIIERIVQYC